MDNHEKYPIYQSARFRIVFILIVILLLTISITTYLGINAILNAIQSAQNSSETVIRSQGEQYLLQIIQRTARENDLILERIGQDALYMSYYTQDIFNDVETFTDKSYWDAEDQMYFKEDGRFVNGEDDLVSVYVPAFAKFTDLLTEHLNLTSYIDHVFHAVFENNPNVVAIYLGTTDEITRYYPNIGLGEILPPDFQVTQRPWYTAAVEGYPNSNVTWSPIYEDSTGKGFLVTAASPAFTVDNQLIGVVGIDVTLEEISGNVAATQLAEGGYSFLIDETGAAITLPDQGFSDILNREKEPDELGTDLSTTTSSFSPIINRMLGGETGFESILINEEEYFIVFAPLENTGWSLGSVISAQEILRSTSLLGEEFESSAQRQILSRIIPFSVILLVFASMIGLLATNRLTQPLQELIYSAQRLGSGEWDTQLPKTSVSEISTLTDNFAKMAEQLQQNVVDLETRVAERTETLERRSQQLQTAADVGSAVATNRDLDSLLNQISQTISERFAFYHVGIFLLDKDKENAVLKAANSEGGARMLARNHSLRIGEEGIVGYVAGSGQPRIALDVGTDAVHFRNPDLPETRSELSLPLFAGGILLGVLDVQSTEPEAFSEEDIAVLQVLADLVAVAIENAQLFEESQHALETAQRMTTDLSSSAWREILSTQESLGFRTDLSDLITPSSVDWSKDMVKASNQGEIIQVDDYTITVPITLRDQVLGVVRLKKADRDGVWKQSEIQLMDTLVDQLEIALESARLYLDSQRQASRERLVTEITTKIRGTTDPQTMINTAITELQKALRAQRAQAFLNPQLD